MKAGPIGRTQRNRRMREWTKPAGTLLLGLSLLFFCLLIYLSHIPINYTYDGMVFAARIEREHAPLWIYFHPHHLLYTFLGRLIFLWGKANGASWDGLVALQFFNILTGVSGILLTFHLLVRETNDRLMASLTTAGLAFTFSYWYFSTSPGVRIFATVTPLLAWYLLTYLKDTRPAWGGLVGLAHALAVTGHQTNLLLIPAFLGGIWCLDRMTSGEKGRASFYYLAALTTGVLAAYGFVGRYIYIRKTYSEWVWWVFSYFHVPQWGGHLQEAGFEQGKFAMMRAFLTKSLPYKTLSSADSFTFETARTLFQYALLALLVVLLVRLQFYWKNHRQALWVSFFWLLAFVPFFIWWEPWNIEFWVSSTVPCWVLMGIVASDLSFRFKNPVLHFANRFLFTGLWAALVLLLFFYNFQGSIEKTRSASARGHEALMEALDWKVKVDDLLVLDGINTIPFYLDRYQKRKYLNLHAFFKKYEEKKEDKNAFEGAKRKKKTPVAEVPKPDPWKDLDGLFQNTWRRHRKVWVLAEAVDEDDMWRGRLEQLMKFSEGQLTVFFRQYPLAPVPYHGKVYFYQVGQPQVTPTPTPETLPTPAAHKGKKKGKKT